MSKILVTGAAGFIGSFLSELLLKNGNHVFGIDNLNNYYDIKLKESRLEKLSGYKNFEFVKQDISDKVNLLELFEREQFEIVVNLAAQAGVRYSIDNPDVYIQSNIIGFYNILEACRKFPVKHLLYASSSSVYGSNKEVPFKETDFVDHPVSLYAATKKSNELMAHTYSHLYGIPTTGLRFFTVYGPLGRPDMAYFKFANMYFNEESIHIYNNGDFENDLYRDFTYIDDIVIGIEKLINIPPVTPNGLPAHTVYNIGNNNPEKLMTFIFSLENALSNSLNRKVNFKKIYEPIKPGDVPATYANTDKLQNAINFKPQTSIQEGLQKFADWYVDFYDLT
ncbi:NAD-dependent epimerase/dehydratase family protein [Aerococcus agrisoli]|uniref:NAD-dependent epimerase/dehydratase family protein n=1 Tax=Aerococcus agrisoli TaxID=2487350 RepID=A0A3N4GNH3_9LACT|nr:GDP-mannose 4,6-dehydratase [Aerococcus agrisoli]RPA60691.1 NAD-dependent epimerase/dehydratase family protein [Aerococcus agrisoli]